MKKFILSLVVLFSITITSSAQSRFGVTAGANLSTSSAKDMKWKAGGYIGALWDIQLGEKWFVQPQLLYSYEEYEKKKTTPLTAYYSQHALSLPVLLSYKINIGNSAGLYLNAGPYLKYALFGRDRQLYTDGSGKSHEELGWWHAGFSDRLTYGLQGGLMLEKGRWFCSLNCRYGLKKNPLNLDGHGLNLSVGVGYKFK
jgi:hypothetical protein